MAKYQLIRNMNNSGVYDIDGRRDQQQPKGSARSQWRRRCLPKMCTVLLGALIYIAAYTTRLTWQASRAAHDRDDGTAAAARLKSSFVVDASPRKMKMAESVDSQKSDSGNLQNQSSQTKSVDLQSRESSNAQNQSTKSPSSSVSVIDRLLDRSRRVAIPDAERTLAFVHVGKSGGSTISLLLRNGCMKAIDGEPCDPPDRWTKIPGQVEETVASKRIQFYLHTPHVEERRMAEAYGRVSSVVVVARDPLERFVSAFLCRHPRNIDATRLRNTRIRRQYEARGEEPPAWAKTIWGGGNPEEDQVHRASFTGCYDNVEQLARCAAGVEPDASKVHRTKISWYRHKAYHTKDISLNCRDICAEVVSGENKFIHHVRFNYKAFSEYRCKDIAAVCCA